MTEPLPFRFDQLSEQIGNCVPSHLHMLPFGQLVAMTSENHASQNNYLISEYFIFREHQGID